MRATEEICCDEMVMCCLKPKPRSYANSILTVVETLAQSALRVPAMASEINSGGFLERRFRMIVSETPNRSNSRWLQRLVLLLAIVVLPVGMVYAKESKKKSDTYLEQVWGKLQAEVAAGNMTSDEAGAMMGALKKARFGKDNKDKMIAMKKKAGAKGKAKSKADYRGKKGKSDVELKKVWAELQGAVKVGKLSEKDAKAKMAAYKKKAGAKKDIDYEAIGKKIRAAVQSGKMTAEEGRAKMAAIRKSGADKKDIDYEAIGKRLKAAVKAGKLTEEEAKAKWNAIKKKDSGKGGK